MTARATIRIANLRVIADRSLAEDEARSLGTALAHEVNVALEAARMPGVRVNVQELTLRLGGAASTDRTWLSACARSVARDISGRAGD